MRWNEIKEASESIRDRQAALGYGLPLEQIPQFIVEHIHEGHNCLNWESYIERVFEAMDYDRQMGDWNKFSKWLRTKAGRVFKENMLLLLQKDAGELRDLFNKRQGVLHRVMSVRPNFSDQFTTKSVVRLGTYWSHDRDSIAPPDDQATQWSHQFNSPHRAATSDLIMSCRVSAQAVDWASTLHCFSEFGDFENEIRLLDRAPVELIAMSIDHQAIDVSAFTARTIA